MSDDLKANKQGAEPDNTQSQTAPPIPPTPIQANPQKTAAHDGQKSRPQKRSPILRFVRIVRKHRREFPKWTDIAIVILTAGIVFLAYMQHRDMADSGIQTDKIIAADERLPWLWKTATHRPKMRWMQVLKHRAPINVLG